MRCLACCTASSYDIKALQQHFSHTHLYRDVLHTVKSASAGPADIFFFPYGTFVAWGLSSDEEKWLLQELRPFEIHPIGEPETDSFTYSFDKRAKINRDEILLPDTDVLTRLAISHGLAQSVKLSTFEIAIQTTVKTTKQIPEALATRGKIPLSRKEIRRMMGQLFIERSNINLHLDVLDTPEFFWEYSELEPYYLMAAKYLDIETRVEVLNQRLDVVHELFGMLGNELHHQHSSRLEWTIIALILIEVALTLLRDVFGIL